MPLLIDPRHGHSHGAESGGHSHGGHSHGAPGEAVGFVASAAPARARRTLERGAGRGKVLFLDAFSGIAGDMTMAALIDLGVPRAVVDDAVVSLGLAGASLVVREGFVGALGATHVDVAVTGAQSERSYAEIRTLIDAASLSPAVRELAQKIFLRLAEAEAEVHRIDVTEVQFHEVGAIDAIVDIVGAAACIEYLGAEVVATPLPMGRGFVECRHGVLPLPAPATVLCLRGVPTYDAEIDEELVTPTGAAIVAGVASRFARWPRLGPIAVGLGAGTKAFADRPNLLRAVLGEAQSALETEEATHALIETNVDDMTGEVVAHVIARLMDAGALDAWAVASTTKKGRPGLVLSALTTLPAAGSMADALLRETSSLGVRITPVTRVELSRSIVEIETAFGPIPIKVSGAGEPKAKPEFDVCAKIASERGLPVRQVLAEASRAAEEWLRRGPRS